MDTVQPPSPHGTPLLRILALLAFALLIAVLSSLGTYLVLNNQQQSFERSIPPPGPVYYTSPTPTKNSKVLKIPELGVQFKLSKYIEDAYYNKSSTSPGAFSLRVHSLDSEEWCKNNDLSVAGIFKSDKNYKIFDEESITTAYKGTVIGNDYYYIAQSQYVCAQQKENQALLESVVKAFTEASSTIEKIQ